MGLIGFAVIIALVSGPAPWNHPKLQHKPTGNEAVSDADQVQPMQRTSGFNQGFKPTALSPGDLAELMEAAVELRSATPDAEQEKEEELLAVVAAVSARASAQDGVQDTRPSSKGPTRRHSSMSLRSLGRGSCNRYRTRSHLGSVSTRCVMLHTFVAPLRRSVL